MPGPRWTGGIGNCRAGWPCAWRTRAGTADCTGDNRAPRRPDRAQLAFDAEGRLARLEEAGWVVEYQGYGEDTLPPMPARIALEHAGLRLRLVVDQWQRLAPAGATDD
ncbi:MAG: hypothetical protein LC646_04000 [Xanthomonadaceae bacterium]|nr:hypothetical protein [Xanthomonadaceae bacterium]